MSTLRIQADFGPLLGTSDSPARDASENTKMDVYNLVDTLLLILWKVKLEHLRIFRRRGNMGNMNWILVDSMKVKCGHLTSSCCCFEIRLPWYMSGPSALLHTNYVHMCAHII